MKLIFPAIALLLAVALADASVWAGETEQEAELVKKSLNPVADLISLPIQNNWDWGIGPAGAMRFTMNVQPVIPVSVSADWNVIIRTIAPIISQQSPIPNSGGTASGLGDITQSFFLSPRDTLNGWIVGLGPALLYPSAADSRLGSGKWGAGPTFVVLRQESGWTVGMLANQVWSYAGQSDRSDVSSAFLQPFLGYSTRTYTTFLVNTESTYDFKADQWTVPVNLLLTQMIKIGKQPVSLQLGYRYYFNQPPGGPDAGMRFAVTWLFPK